MRFKLKEGKIICEGRCELKVLFVGSDSHLGGAEQITLALIEATSKWLHPAFLLGSASVTDSFSGEVVRSSWIAEPSYGRRLNKLINRIKYLHFSVKARSLSKAIGSDIEPDVIYSMNTQWIAYAAPLARFLKKPLVWHIHDMPSYIPKRKMSYFLSFMNNVSLAICICERQRRELIELGFPADKTSVIHNGIEAVNINRPSEKTHGTKLKLLFLGELSHRKGFDLIPELMNSDLKTSLELRIAGKIVDRELYRRVVEDLEKMNVQFQYLGEIGQKVVIDVLSESDYLLLPSRSEVWPTVVMEAMFCGCIPLMTDVGGTRDMIPDELEDLLIFSPDDRANPTALILHIEKESGLKNSVREKCMAYATENFDIRVTADKWGKKIKQVVCAGNDNANVVA